jgi:radical SAM protein with 4Fe4S-binding SPASM domain
MARPSGALPAAKQPFFETPPKITLCITQTCNLQCKHCYSDCNSVGLAAELSTDEWLRFIDYLVSNDFIQIYIEGGEPLFRKDFKDILRYCSRKLMTLVRTNGTLITRETAEEFKEIGVGRVLVDIMGATAETHDFFAGVPGSFAKACAALEHLIDVGISTDMLIILNRRNVGELQQYVDLAHRLGVPRVGILRLYPLGRTKRQWADLALSLEEQMEALAALVEPKGLKVMRSWHPKDRNCCWQSAAVNPFGDSIGCPYLREYVNYGNIRTMAFLDTWHNDPLYKQLRAGEVEKSCPDCHASDGTRGGCRSTAFAFQGRWTAPDPFCSTLNEGVDLRVLPDGLLQQNREYPS